MRLPILVACLGLVSVSCGTPQTFDVNTSRLSAMGDGYDGTITTCAVRAMPAGNVFAFTHWDRPAGVSIRAVVTIAADGSRPWVVTIDEPQGVEIDWRSTSCAGNVEVMGDPAQGPIDLRLSVGSCLGDSLSIDPMSSAAAREHLTLEGNIVANGCPRR